MRKSPLFLIVLIIICLTLAACMNRAEEKALVGEWISQDGSDIVVFSEDGTVRCSNGETLEWWYSKTRKKYYISYFEVTFGFTVKNDDHIRSFTISGDPYYHVEDYEEAVKAQQLQQ